MKKRQNFSYIVCAVMSVLFLVCLSNFTAADTFDLEYMLTEGGFQLELDNLNRVSRGVRITVNSDVATRYEIVQRVIQPLKNRENPGLTIEDNFVIRGVQGTNRFGNLRIPSSDVPVRDGEVLYVSNPAGDADDCTVVYGLNRVDEIKPGEYFGRISFSLSPISSSRQEVTKILEVHVSINQGIDNKPQIEFSTASGERLIALSTRKDGAKTSDISVRINGDFNGIFSIKQSLSGPLASPGGEALDDASVNFLVRGATKGIAVNQFMPLSSQLQDVYISEPSGEADKNFVITYSLKDLTDKKAGNYRARINYLLEEAGVETRLETIDLEIENERIFDLLITPQDQKSIIEFRDLKPNQPPKTSEVLMEIKTNLGKPYQVTQDIKMELTNKDGSRIADEYFTLRTVGIDTKGNVQVIQNEKVSKGSTVLFVSDQQGSADKFKIVYELTCPKEARAGDYATNVTYSIMEI